MRRVRESRSEPPEAKECWTKAVTGKDGVERNIPEFGFGGKLLVLEGRE